MDFLLMLSIYIYTVCDLYAFAYYIKYIHLFIYIGKRFNNSDLT